MDKYITILSIDGGGIRGIIPAMVLAEIERKTGKPIADLFHLVAGTSTGGILALGLLLPDGTGRPKYTAAEMVALYRDEGLTIFPWHLLAEAVAAFRGPKYPADGIESVLLSQFGDARLKDAITNVLITGYDLERGRAVLFKSDPAKQDPSKDYLMREIARGTSAAPTYFDPFKLVPDDPSMPYLSLIDGGVYANNPSLVALSEVKRLYGDDQTKIAVVSLGTGELTHKIDIAEASEWGALEWTVPILNILFNEQSAAVDAVMQHLLDSPAPPSIYYRFQGLLDASDDAMDNAMPKNIQALQNVGVSVIQDNRDKLDVLCAHLLEIAAAPSPQKTTQSPP